MNNILAAAVIIAALAATFSCTRYNKCSDHLHIARKLPLNGAVGPESFAFDPAGGGPYAGVADGRVLKWQGDSTGWTDFATIVPNRKDCFQPSAPELEHICGRPLGLRFHNKTGNLYIADGYFGLVVVGPEGGLAKRLVNEAEGQTFMLTNDMDIDEENGVIYFTDTSKYYARRQFMQLMLSGDKTGRLFKYKISTKEVTVLLRDLAFSNGVALSKDRSFVLVAETTSCRITRLWLTGPNAGKHDVFAELPGFPDNVRRNSQGEFWVAIHAKAGFMPKLLLSAPWIGRTILKLLPLEGMKLHGVMEKFQADGAALKLSEDGQILEMLEDSKGGTLKATSIVDEREGRLWIGSVAMPFIGVYTY